MARKKSKKNGMASGLFEKVRRNRGVLFLVIGAALLIGMGSTAVRTVLSSGTFEIRKVTVNNIKGYSFNEDEGKIRERYLGRNIFSIDLKQTEGLIRNDFGHFKRVEVRRILPDTLYVEIISREPIAVIDSLGGVIIDREGFVLDIGNEPKNLTKIIGVNFIFKSPAKGSIISNRNLDKALVLLKAVDEIFSGTRTEVDSIDVSDSRNTTLSVKGVLIKMGADNFRSKLEKLREIIRDPDMDIVDMNYIDLRFDDAVLSPR
ncbi:MAG: hypothetical protein KKG84_00695 [Candidatus Omnitrophica bacterium]|nr:hypothetical protein [Candidatus Omnitrophota bacterium]